MQLLTVNTSFSCLQNVLYSTRICYFFRLFTQNLPEDTHGQTPNFSFFSQQSSIIITIFPSTTKSIRKFKSSGFLSWYLLPKIVLSSINRYSITLILSRVFLLKPVLHRCEMVPSFIEEGGITVKKALWRRLETGR